MNGRAVMRTCNFIFLLLTMVFYLQAQIMAVDTKESKEDVKTMLPKKMIVCVPVADVRTEPKEPALNIKLPIESPQNPLQETQALYGEHLLALEECNGWIRIQALEQQKNCNGKWQGYPGWIKKEQAIAVDTFPAYNLVVTKPWTSIYDDNGKAVSAVCMGTKLQGTSCDKSNWNIVLHDGSKGTIANSDVYEITQTVYDDEKSMREQIVLNALSFVDAWYSWGGRSVQNEKLLVSSVDCSGLTSLAFRAMGLDIGRDAHDQYLQAAVLKDGTSMLPGDLIFHAPKTKKRMNHVMIYLGKDLLLETLYKDNMDHCRIISTTDKLGTSITQLADGQECKNYIVHLGSFLGSKQIINQLRSQALRTSYN